MGLVTLLCTKRAAPPFSLLYRRPASGVIMRYYVASFFSAIITFVFTFPARAMTAADPHGQDMQACGPDTGRTCELVIRHMLDIPALHPAGLFAIAVFVISYLFVLTEEKTQLRKSKPVMLGAALIWITIGFLAPHYNVGHHELKSVVFHALGEYASLMLFLLAAMTFINTMENRQVFASLRARLVQAGFNFRQLFWATGVLAFFLSPVADNLTTALVLGAVVLALGQHNTKFIAMGCINIVNAANAGGAFSPFGDITTLMVWQAGQVEFFEFFSLFLPSVVMFLIPATIMSFFIPKEYPEPIKEEVRMKCGAKVFIALGILTIATAVSFEQVLGLPPFLGMMAGLSLLMIWSYFVRMWSKDPDDQNFHIMYQVQRAEWDTLLFFYGVIFSVGGLAYMGYMELASQAMYVNLGDSVTNIILGFASAIIDNIPVMFAVLSMEPDMSHFQWLLVTLTTGVGGSMLSIGSAAGVALMGAAHGKYTFMRHLKWSPVIVLGYFASIAVHFYLNHPEFGLFHH